MYTPRITYRASLAFIEVDINTVNLNIVNIYDRELNLAWEWLMLTLTLTYLLRSFKALRDLTLSIYSLAVILAASAARLLNKTEKKSL